MKNSVSDLSDSHLLWQSGSSRVCKMQRSSVFYLHVKQFYQLILINHKLSDQECMCQSYLITSMEGQDGRHLAITVAPAVVILLASRLQSLVLMTSAYCDHHTNNETFTASTKVLTQVFSSSCTGVKSQPVSVQGCHHINSMTS